MCREWARHEYVTYLKESNVDSPRVLVVVAIVSSMASNRRLSVSETKEWNEWIKEKTYFWILAQCAMHMLFSMMVRIYKLNLRLKNRQAH